MYVRAEGSSMSFLSSHLPHILVGSGLMLLLLDLSGWDDHLATWSRTARQRLLKLTKRGFREGPMTYSNQRIVASIKERRVKGKAKHPPPLTRRDRDLQEDRELYAALMGIGIQSLLTSCVPLALGLWGILGIGEDLGFEFEARVLVGLLLMWSVIRWSTLFQIGWVIRFVVLRRVVAIIELMLLSCVAGIMWVIAWPRKGLVSFAGIVLNGLGVYIEFF